MTATTAALLKLAMSALPEAEQWSRDIGLISETPEDCRATMLAAVEARVMRVAVTPTPDEVRSLVAESVALLAELVAGPEGDS